MDILLVLFAISLLIVGLLLVAFVIERFNRKVNFGDESPTLHQQALKAYRRMERQRGRVWFKIEGLYAEFVQKSALEDQAGKLLPSAVPAQASENKVSAEGEKGLNVADIQEAYEVFLREDYLTAPGMNCPMPSNKQFQPPV